MSNATQLAIINCFPQGQMLDPLRQMHPSEFLSKYTSQYTKSRYPFGYLLFCYAERLDSKGRPCQRQGKKVSRGHFLSPWESPWIVGCIRRIVDHYPFLFGYLLFCFYGCKGLEGLDPSCRWQLGRCRLDGIGTLQFCTAKLDESLPAYAALWTARERITTSLCSSQ